MKPYKIAVCLSGEPRTWENCIDNILNFFHSSTHEIVFFGHTWTTSEYTKEAEKYRIPKIENHDPIILKDKLLTKINFQGLHIEDKSIIDINPILEYESVPCDFASKYNANLLRPVQYTHMSYSIMMANWLKTQYELKNNMQFDIVVRTRFDLYFKKDTTFENFITENINPIYVYGYSGYFPFEYWQNSMNDTVFFGSSRVMNTLCNFYRYYSNGKFWQLLDSNWNDSYIKNCGYNVALYKWSKIKNIHIKENELCFNSYIFRKSASHLKLPQDHESIFEYERNLFS